MKSSVSLFCFPQQSKQGITSTSSISGSEINAWFRKQKYFSPSSVQQVGAIFVSFRVTTLSYVTWLVNEIQHGGRLTLSAIKLSTSKYSHSSAIHQWNFFFMHKSSGSTSKSIFPTIASVYKQFSAWTCFTETTSESESQHGLPQCAEISKASVPAKSRHSATRKATNGCEYAGDAATSLGGRPVYHRQTTACTKFKP